jgi:hypothetical protein
MAGLPSGPIPMAAPFIWLGSCIPRCLRPLRDKLLLVELFRLTDPIHWSNAKRYISEVC